MAGLSPLGFEMKRLDDLRQDVRAAIRAALGPAVQMGTDTVLGTVIDRTLVQLAVVWELAQAHYDALSRDAAEGVYLDNLVALIGLRRLGATRTAGTVTASGTDSTVIPPGAIVRIPGGPRFVVTSGGTISGGTATLEVEAEEEGAIDALAGSITEIVTLTAGWTGVTNPTDLTPGRDVETDAQLRLRAERSVQRPSAATDAAIAARLREVPDVQHAAAISNRSMVAVDGQPPKSVHPVVWPSSVDSDAVLAALWEVVPAGIEVYGTTTGTVTTASGYQVQLAFSYAEEIEIHVEVVLTVSTDYPVDGDDIVAASVLAAGNALSVGDDVRLWRLECAAADHVEGIETVEVRARVGAAPTAGHTSNIQVSLTQIARFDSARITVTR